MVQTEAHIVGAESKILATKHKNSTNIPNASFRIQNSSNVTENNSYKQKIILTKYKKNEYQLVQSTKYLLQTQKFKQHPKYFL